MSFIRSKATISVIEVTPHAAHCDLYCSKLEMVLSEIDKGTLGDGTWGSEKHKKALEDIKGKINVLLQIINVKA